MMGPREIITIFLGCIPIMLVWRCVPLLTLKDKELSPKIKKLLSFIPVASFSALVANDLISFAQEGSVFPLDLVPLVAALPVFFVAKRTGSLIASALIGLAVYYLLSVVL